MDLRSQMPPQSTTSPLGQHLEVSARLRCLNNPKGVFLTGYRHIECIGACDLQEDSGIRPALVRLSSRVQKARPKAQTGSDALVIAHLVPQSLKTLFVLRIHLHIAERGELVTGLVGVRWAL